MHCRLLLVLCVFALAIAISQPGLAAQPARLELRPGASSIDVSGKLQPGEAAYYIIHTDANQPLIASIESRSRNLFLSILGQSDHRTILSSKSRKDGWQGTLATAQDYLIGVISTGKAATSFTLNLIIPRRIQFAKGTSSASVSGKASTGLVTAYVVRARAGQTISAGISSRENTVALTIWGFADGEPLVRGTASDATSWTGKLPRTQDYIVEATQFPDKLSDYTLNISIK